MRTDFNELHAARVFLTVVNSGSFAQASRINGSNASTVTRIIGELERRLGVQLFARTTRSLKLTDAGMMYRPFAEQMLAAHLGSREALAEVGNGGVRGMLRVTMPISIGELWIAHYLQAFHARYPDIEVQLELTDRVLALASEGYDLAIRIGVLADSTLRVRQIATLTRKIYATQAYLDQHGSPQCPNDLQQHSCLVRKTEVWQFWRGTESQVQRISAWLQCSNLTILSKLLRAGLGIARAPVALVRSSNGGQGLIELLPDWACDDPVHGGPPLSLVYPPSPNGTTPLKTRLFIDFLLQALSEIDMSSFGIVRV